MDLIYHGQAMFEVRDASTRLLFDPWVEGNPHCSKILEDFTDVDAIFVTHGAGDHLGDAPEIARRSNASLYCDYATQLYLKKSGFPERLLNGMIYGQAVAFETWSMKVVEAHHLSKFDELDVIGPALAFIVQVGDDAIYHMGDTALFSDMKLYGELYEPNICLVPVGQAHEGTQPDLHPREAAIATGWISPELAIPMHYMPGSTKPQEFEEYCDKTGVSDSTTIAMLDPGESIER